MKIKKCLYNIIFWLTIIAVDFCIYAVLGLLLMQYEDFYDNSKGEMWSLVSMNTNEKIIYICLNIWNILNIIALICIFIYIIQKIYKRIKS